MSSLRILAALSLFVAFILAGSSLVAGATVQDYQSGPEGEIFGYVVGASGYPFDWAEILVVGVGANHTYHTFSGMSGFYLIRVPAGTYNVTARVPGYTAVSVPGYTASNVIVAVTDGSSTRVDFHLAQSQVPVPELPVNKESIILVIALACGLVLVKRRAGSLM